MSRLSKLLFLFVFVIVLLVMGEQSSAQNCWDLKSVTNSAMVANNTSAGGHLTQHIYGQIPPPRMTQMDKNLFINETQYRRYMNVAKSASKQQHCQANPSKGKRSLFQMIRINNPKAEAYVCGDVIANGQCSTWGTIAPSRVFFNFVFKKQWILNSAYPD